MNAFTRRDFLKTAGLVSAAATIPLDTLPIAESPASSKALFSFGIASYTFRSFTLDQTIEMTKRLGLTHMTLKEMHLPLTSTAEEIALIRKKIADAGLMLASCGVVYMKTEEEIKNGFAYATAVGLKMLVGVPDQSLLPVAERYVKETDIILAIHNHGPTDQRFPSPESAYRLIEKMDSRMGLCIDVGHTQRLGVDPSTEIERFADRLFDVHIKDVNTADAKGTTVEMGRGVIDIPKILKTLIRLKYSRTVHFEFEKDQKDPLPGVAESVGFTRGVIAAL
jgi:inosose dehydratase